MVFFQSTINVVLSTINTCIGYFFIVNGPNLPSLHILLKQKESLTTYTNSMISNCKTRKLRLVIHLMTITAISISGKPMQYIIQAHTYNLTCSCLNQILPYLLFRSILVNFFMASQSKNLQIKPSNYIFTISI
jgi:hypothetical protein